jgi:hypothetical protein
MKSGKLAAVALVACLLITAPGCTKVKTLGSGIGSIGAAPAAPHLEKRGNVIQLIVEGKPYLALAGELHNSASSSAEHMQSIWPKLQQMNLNTVLAVVSWEQIEPREGQFDFTVVDQLLRDARKHDMRLAVLWFGSWKNGTSRYQPAWVKADTQRFPLIRNKAGNTLEILSALSEETCKADAKAFAALMRHIKQVDSRERTVIMIQMQNEVGVLGDSRDRSPAADAAFAAQVPPPLVEYLTSHRQTLRPELRKLWDANGNKTSGTWEELFGAGPATDEAFQAWNYARFCNYVTEAGKAEYNLPTFVNAWIVQPEDKGPGDYPAGGPQSHVHDLWLAGAPSIDILAPDIYLPDFPGIVKMYAEKDRAMFVPESRPGALGAANAYYAIGQAGSIGYSPFGIEDREEVGGGIPLAYRTLAQLAPHILEHQAKGSIGAIWLSKEKPSDQISLGNYTVTAQLRKDRRNPSFVPDLGYVMIMNTGADEYLLSGSDVQVTFSPNTPGAPIVGLANVQEMIHVPGGKFTSEKWVPGRILNGDEVQLRYDLSPAAAENQSGAGIRFLAGAPGIQKVTLYRYGGK